MAERDDIYLSRGDVEDLARYAFPIPVTRGFAQDYVSRKYPGWQWNELFPSLVTTGRFDKETHVLRTDLAGVLFTAEGDLVDDDGTLVHPAKPTT